MVEASRQANTKIPANKTGARRMKLKNPKCDSLVESISSSFTKTSGRHAIATIPAQKTNGNQPSIPIWGMVNEPMENPIDTTHA